MRDGEHNAIDSGTDVESPDPKPAGRPGPKRGTWSRFLAVAVVAIFVASAFAVVSLGTSKKTLIPDDENEKSAKAQLGGTRTITYQIYDIGESYLKPTDYSKLGRHDHSKSGINSWFLPRNVGYNDTIIRNKYPYVVSYDPYSSWLKTGLPKYDKARWTTHSFYALKMDAENIASIATGTGAGAADPWMLPIMAGGASPETLAGGYVNMSMYFTYLTTTEYDDISAGVHYANSYYSVDTTAFDEWYKFYADDGWLMEAQGVFDFDTDAAKKFLGLAGSGNLITDFNAVGAVAIGDAWEQEWIADADTDCPLDIYAKYDFHILSGNGPVFITVSLDPSSAPDKLVMRFWSLTWGGEALYTNYLQKTGITEELQPYMEDWYLNGTFTPTMGDIHSKQTASYHLVAWKDPDFFNAAWLFEPQNMDYTGYDSLYTSYYNSYYCGWYGNTYLPLRKCWVPAQEFFGANVHFWQTPMAWNLTADESLSIQLPVNKPGWGIKPYKSTNFTLPGNSAVEQGANGYFGEWVLGHSRPMADIYTLANYTPSTKTLFWQGPKNFAAWPDEGTPSYPGSPYNVLEGGTPSIIMDIARVSHYKLDILGGPSYGAGKTYVLQVTPQNFTNVNSYSNQTVELLAVAGVTYGASTHTFAWNESSWNTTIVFATAGAYSLVSQDQYFYLDVTDTYAFTVLPTFALPIYAGWNFITVPRAGWGYKAGNLTLEKGDIVASWNPATKTYDKTFIVGVSPPALDFTLATSTGYWVFADSNETVYLFGADPTGTVYTRSITVPAGGGWVNIGLTSLKTTWKASNIALTMWSGSNMTLVAMYNPVTKVYKTYIKGVPPSDYTLVPGYAVWCLVDGSGTLTYTA